MATKLTKQLNSQFNPVIVGGYPVYKCGGRMYGCGGRMMRMYGGFTQNAANNAQFMNWAANNPASKGIGLEAGGMDAVSAGADMIGGTLDAFASNDSPYQKKSVAGSALSGAAKGAAMGSIVPGLGTVVGGALGGLTSAFSSWMGNKKAEEEYNQEQDALLQKQNAMMAANLPGQQAYKRTFAYGGKATGMPQGKATMEDVKYYQKLYPEEMAMGRTVEYEHTKNKNLADRIAADHVKDFEKMAGGPGYYAGLKQAGLTDELAYGGKVGQYLNGGGLDNTSLVTTGGTHEANPNGGVPMGQNALVEEGEYIWKGPEGKYVFSNRF